jgi:hypothetical protein
MATAFPTVAVSLVFLLWDACRRAGQLAVSSRPAVEPSDGDQHVEHRLDCLTVMVKHVPRR